MRMTITMQMDNASFRESGLPGVEAADILRGLADKIEGSEFVDVFDRHTKLMDTNGNTVGEMVVTGR